MQQRPLRLAAPDEPAVPSLFDDRLLLTLAAANDAFLRLVVELRSAPPAGPVLGVPAGCAASLAALGGHRRNALAGLPYALFDLRLRDDDWWGSLARGVGVVADATAQAPAEACLAGFSRHALTLAWHLAQVSEAAARLALGAGDGALATLRAVPLAAIDGVAAVAGTRLQARFPAAGPYWRLFLHCAVAPEPAAHAALRRLGVQLMGMDAARCRGVQRGGRRHAVP